MSRSSPKSHALESPDFLTGICVALQIVKDYGDSVCWRDIVRCAGEDELLYYAAHTEPDEWELSGFSRYALTELGKAKPPMKK